MTHTTDPNTLTIKKKTIMDNGCGGIYGLAFLGALVYFIQHASTFWEGVLGIFKAIFWPGVLMYKLLEYLKI
jgi:hypothetical protein